MKYDVTIAIPVYNASAFIKQSLLSVLKQSYKDIEILVLNDCSTDNSVEVIENIAREYKIAVNIYNASANCGVGSMRNKAIELARGEYLYFLDSDDLMSEDCMELMMLKARLHDADLVIGSHVDVRNGIESENKEKPFFFEKVDEFAHYAFSEHYGYQGGVWNKLIKIKLLREEHILFPDYRVGEDVPFIFNLITKVQRVVLIDKITYRYIIRQGSLCQYNPRFIIPKNEIKTHIASKMLLREILANNTKKSFYFQMASIVTDYSLDTVRVLIEKKAYLEEPVKQLDLKELMKYPVTFGQMMKYGNRKDWLNYFLCSMPYSVVEVYFKIRKLFVDWIRG